MAFADLIRGATATLNDVADLLESIFTSGYNTNTWTAWTPTYSGNGSLTFGTVTTNYAKYLRCGKMVWFQISATGIVAGTGSAILFTLPFTAANVNIDSFDANFVDGGSPVGGFGFLNTTTQAGASRYNAANLTAGTVILNCSGFLEVA